MALKINKALSDRSGGTVPSGTIVKFDTLFPKAGGVIKYALFCYKSQADYDAGKDCYVPIEVTSFSPAYTLQQGDYDTLTPAVVHSKLKNILEAMSGIGVGMIEIVE